MAGEIAVEQMGPDLLLWRCLHGGPVTRENLERPGPYPPLDWPALRARNVPLLAALVEAYGSCAVVARENDRIVGAVRFYPKAVWAMAGSAGFCMQAPFPAGPPPDLARTCLPSLDELEDRTLRVHCLTAGRPGIGDDPLRRRGIGSRMVRTLIDWAARRGWRAIESTAYADLDTLYTISGAAGPMFWEKLGFRTIAVDVEPELRKEGEILDALRREARAKGFPEERLADRRTMRLDLR